MAHHDSLTWKVLHRRTMSIGLHQEYSFTYLIDYDMVRFANLGLLENPKITKAIDDVWAEIHIRHWSGGRMIDG